MDSTHDVVILYHSLGQGSATTITEHIAAFNESTFSIKGINVGEGYPPDLDGKSFPVVVLHYSLFGIWPYSLNEAFLAFLHRSESSFKVAMFQDEYRYCRNRFEFINRYHIDCIYTLLEPQHQGLVYGAHTSVTRIIYTLPGYVSQNLVRSAAQWARPDDQRSIDIGYRGRILDFSLGFGGVEKAYIGEMAQAFLEDKGLMVDIEVDEDKRLYGEDWNRFIGNCKGMLGTESGVTIFDLDDRVRETCEVVRALAPGTTFLELWDQYLCKHSNQVYYRMMSPRHFEASAFRVCQILFEGDYSGLLLPMENYLPLKKDFSNLEEVLCLFQDSAIRKKITDNCYAEFIDSGRYDYTKFVQEFDLELRKAGFNPSRASGNGNQVISWLPGTSA